jgi:hypothetical protein
LQPLSSEDEATLISDYRNSVSPLATIVGCAICGEKMVLNEGDNIAKNKIALSKLSRFLVDKSNDSYFHKVSKL